MMNKEQKAEECDATTVDQGTEAGNTIKLSSKELFKKQNRSKSFRQLAEDRGFYFLRKNCNTKINNMLSTISST